MKQMSCKVILNQTVYILYILATIFSRYSHTLECLHLFNIAPYWQETSLHLNATISFVNTTFPQRLFNANICNIYANFQ